MEKKSSLLYPNNALSQQQQCLSSIVVLCPDNAQIICKIQTSKIQTVCDKGIFACSVCTDFKKVFDIVNLEFLLNKFNQYGMRGTKLRWFKTHLRRRQQHTTVSSLSSKKAYIKYGVLQGSVLRPLLFLIYINDLNKAINVSDDTSLLLSDKLLKKINNTSIMT